MRVKQIGLLLYALSVLGILLSVVDNVPGAVWFSRAKYVYLVFLVVYFFTYKPCLHKKVAVIFITFLGYTVLFGFFLVNQDVIDLIHDHVKYMLLYIMFAVGTAHFICSCGLQKKFISATFLTFLLVIIWCHFTHLSGFAPFRYLLQLPQIMTNEVEYGFAYGMDNYNLAGNVMATAIWLLALMIVLYRDEHGKLSLFGLSNPISWLFVIGCACYLILMLVSTTSRGEIVSSLVAVFFVLLFWKKYPKRFWRNARIVLAVIIVIVLSVYFSNTVLFNVVAKRTKNIEVNYEIFKNIGRYYTGMGFVNPWSFLSKSFPGYDTWACDVYWAYIFFTTGYIGTAIMAFLLLYFLYQVLVRHTDNYRYDVWIKVMLVMLLVDDFFHCTIFSYNYTPSVVVCSVLLVYIMDSKPNSKKLRRL